MSKKSINGKEINLNSNKKGPNRMISRKGSLMSMEKMSVKSKSRMKMMSRGSTKQITITPIETYKPVDTGTTFVDGAALKKMPG